MKPNILTAKQQLFCDEYLSCNNATQAALSAGYSNTTAMNGQLMNLPKIKLYIQEHTEALSQKAQVNREMVLAELMKIAFADMGSYFDADGGIKPMHHVSADARAALWSVSVGDAGSGGSTASVTKFRMYNKLIALDKIAKILNLYSHDVKPAEKEVVYVETETLTGDDYFDDEELKKEHEVYIDENGERLYGRSGIIPYDATGEVFTFSIDETPEKTIERLKYYENMQVKMGKLDMAFETIDIRKHLSDWMDGELLQYGCVIEGGIGHDVVMEKFRALREFKRKVNKVAAA